LRAAEGEFLLLSMAMQALQLEPLLTFPREAETGKTYLFTVDMRASGPIGAWPYHQTEEVTIYFFVDAGDCFKVEPLGEPAVVLHRFGGTYGPARFLLRAGLRESEGLIRVTYTNGAGMPLGIIESPNIFVRARAQGSKTASTAVRGGSPSRRRGAGQGAESGNREGLPAWLSPSRRRRAVQGAGVENSSFETVDSIIAQAESQMSRGNVTQAEKLYQRAIGILNADHRAWQGLAAIAKQGSAGIETQRLMLDVLGHSLNEYARREAAVAIGASGLESAEFVTSLQLALSDQSALVRAAAVQSISKIGKPKVYELVPALIRVLNDEDAVVRASVATALGTIGDLTAITVLEPSFYDSQFAVRSAAANAVRVLQRFESPLSQRPHVFLNYSNDHTAVDQVYYRLLTEGFDPWMDRFNIPPEANAKREIEREKRNANIVILFLSANSSGKNFEREIKAAVDRWGREPRDIFQVIPARLDQSRIPNRLIRLEPVDLFLPDGWRQLVLRIRHAADTISDIRTETVVPPQEEEIVAGNVVDDPWKGQFGGEAERNFRKLSAKVTKRNDDYYQITLTVSSTDQARHPLSGEVKFYLPPEFAKSQPTVKVGKGSNATVRRLSLRPFTAGALVDRGATRLELDLAELTDAPQGFRQVRGLFREQTSAHSGFKYACFLSYSGRDELVTVFVERFHQALSNELELLTEKPIFFDQKYLEPSVSYEHQVAAALAQSACYIVFCNPTFFSSSMKRRELEAMRLLDERRRGFLSLPERRILPVILRSGSRMPEFLRSIQWLDLREATTAGSMWFRSGNAAQQIQSVARFVFRHCQEADRLPEAFDDWESFALPSENDLPPDDPSAGSPASMPTASDDDASALLNQATEDSRRGDYEAALANMRRALEMYRTLGNTRGETLALNDLGEHYYSTGNYEYAEKHYEQALAAARATSDRSSIAIVQDNLGLVYAEQLRPDKAEIAYRQSLEVFEQLDDKAGMAAVLGNLGLLLLNRNDTGGAIELFDRQLLLARESQSVQREGIALLNLGRSHAKLGDLSSSINYLNQAVAVFEQIGDLRNMAEALYSLSRELAQDGQPAEAIKTGERATVTYARLGATARVDEMNELLVGFRRGLSTRRAPESSVTTEPTDKEKSQGQAKIRKLALQYEKIRRAMGASDERTQRMGEIVVRMRLLVPALHSEVATFAASKSPGIRLAAAVILQDVPNPDYLDWLADRLRIEKPFIGFHASLALLSAVRELDMDHYNRIRDAIAKAKAGLDVRGLKDTDRIRTLEMADRELHQSWTSRYFDPPTRIRTIGRLLKSGTYSELTDQLKTGEVVVGLFRNQMPTLVATYIPNEARRKQMEQAQQLEGYFAVPLAKANKGMRPPIPTSSASAPKPPERKKKPSRSMPNRSKMDTRKRQAKRPVSKKK
jgi:tetratricopeptide (TPR) repeat protein/HEAT repeat protein